MSLQSFGMGEFTLHPATITTTAAAALLLLLLLELVLILIHNVPAGGAG